MMDISSIYWNLSYVHLSAFALVVLTGFVSRRKLDQAGRYFVGYLLGLFLIFLLSLALAKYGIRNLFLGNVVTLVEALLLSLWFPLVLQRQRWKVGAKVLGAFVLLALGVEVLGWHGVENLGDGAALLKSLAVVICASLGIAGLMADDRVDRLAMVPHFWFSVGLLVTNAFSMFFIGFRASLLAYSAELFIQIACLELLLQMCVFVLYGYVFMYRYSAPLPSAT